MTTVDKKISERRTLDAVFGALGMRPDNEPEVGEAPDFMIKVSGCRIGFEVTMYQSGSTVEGSDANRRRAEAESEKLLVAANEYRSTNADIRDINVILTFSGDLPPRRQQNDFVAEIAKFIREHRSELGSADKDYMSWEFSSRLMRDHLRALHLRVCPYAVWYSSLAGGFVGMPDSLIYQIVAAKSQKQYREADELWLAIQSSTKISELLLTLDGVADFERVPSLDGFRFSQVFVLAYDGIYRWKRGEGWCRPDGSPADIASAGVANSA
jgi:hypothetical protein